MRGKFYIDISVLKKERKHSPFSLVISKNVRSFCHVVSLDEAVNATSYLREKIFFCDTFLVVLGVFERKFD